MRSQVPKKVDEKVGKFEDLTRKRRRPTSVLRRSKTKFRQTMFVTKTKNLAEQKKNTFDFLRMGFFAGAIQSWVRLITLEIIWFNLNLADTDQSNLTKKNYTWTVLFDVIFYCVFQDYFGITPHKIVEQNWLCSAYPEISLYACYILIFNEPILFHKRHFISVQYSKQVKNAFQSKLVNFHIKITFSVRKMCQFVMVKWLIVMSNVLN